MSVLAKSVFVAALLGMFAIWVYGAISYARTLQAIRASDENAGMTWHALFNWLFAARRLKGEAAVHAANDSPASPRRARVAGPE